MALIDYFLHSRQPHNGKASEPVQHGVGRRHHRPGTLESSILYRFKKDVLRIMGILNQGVPHQDCETLKRQMLFIQTQLFHAIYNDPDIPEKTRDILMQYHLKSVKATIGDRRHERLRDIKPAPSPVR